MLTWTIPGETLCLALKFELGQTQRGSNIRGINPPNIGNRSELWAWIFCQWVEIEIIDDAVNGVGDTLRRESSSDQRLEQEKRCLQSY